MEDIEKKIDKIREEIKNDTNNKQELLSYLDLTSLSEQDSPKSIRSWLCKVNELDNLGLPSVAAICVYPAYIAEVKQNLNNPRIKIAAVTAGFPASQTFWEIKLAESIQAINTGAHELDMVISVGRFLSEDYGFVQSEIEGIKAKIGKTTLKVILETGVLKSPEKIYKASEIAINAGADFIKTSTGKTEVSATPEAVWLMCSAIKNHFEKTGKKVGIKVAGGVKTSNDAYLYKAIVNNILGETWLTPDLFRIGASSLVNNLLEKDFF